ncbi:hypothetical protein EUX98_g799 [Antrodiella citrinella]|uniref:Cytochrome b-c1 complex subunit 2, mitochondrial n=1 Tax=Antrodiella citrinella TaxID=2447956 RepID=A0A4S4N5C2_9APHY|nr:hypothetical protein EUX98_g799 [Antrodiella citrinella]
MTFRAETLSSTLAPASMDHDVGEPSAGADEDDWSDTSSDITELDPAEFPQYFQERNGRLFHSHGGSPYPLPVDAVEQYRVNGQHALLKARIGHNYVGPVSETLRRTEGRQRRALDLGTGTGVWVLEMAQDFPHVRFDGLDIVPIATRYPPVNVLFEMHDINAPFRYPARFYDLVHGRSISMAVRNYRTLVDEVARILRPRGLFVACEWGRYPSMSRGRDPATYLPRSTEFFRVVNDTLRWYKGIYPVAMFLYDYLRESGHFDEVHQRRVEMPIGGDELGSGFRDMLKMYAESMKVMLLEAGRLSAQEVEDLLSGYLYELENVQGMVSVYHAVHARRKAHRYENKPGVAHALQNFAFKSTAKRSALGTVREAELYGGVLSSSLSREHLALTAEFLRGDESFFVDVLSSFLTDAKFTRHELQEYVAPVCEFESTTVASIPATRAIELAHGLAFRDGLGSPLFASAHHPVTAELVQEYASTVFSKNNIAVLGTGISQDALSELVEKSLASLASSSTGVSSTPSTYFGGETRIENHEGPQTVFVGFGATGAPSAELAVLAAHLSPQSSVKWSKGTSPIAESIPPTASVQTVLLPYSDATLFGFIVQGETTEDVKTAAKAALAALKAAGSFKSDDLKKAVAKAKFAAASSVEGRTGFVNTLGAKVLAGSPSSLDGTLAAFEKVDVSALSNISSTLLKAKPTYVALGDIKGLPYADELGL